ncbi:MAG TPA: T9SS type A sorting domain-containing protein [Saprospiraceae bacterium]|nr:T9SS type A sorting domain-containing protein [Saprospiraceae bacterium]
MKILLSIVLIIGELGYLLYPLQSSAQKFDQHWLIGYDYDQQGNIYNSYLDFSNDTLTVTSRPSLSRFSLSLDISMSDKEGNFLFYSDGCKIAGPDNQVINNGGNINQGGTALAYCSDIGYPVMQGGLVLTSPGNLDQYNYIGYYLQFTDKYGTRPLRLYNHHLDFTNGIGKVTSKNASIIQDTFSSGNLAACKHANGEDWWILAPKIQSNEYYTVLLDKTGFKKKDKQSIGPLFDRFTDWSGQAIFSPDGKKYARYDRGNDLTIFDFDRCDGLLSNPLHITINDYADTLSIGCGIAFSSNSRFLYAPSGLSIYQFDMDAVDIPNSQITVAQSTDSIPANFFLAQLGPDNKIYICSIGSIYALHVIDKPNLPGKACNVKLYNIPLFYQVNGSMPYYPNYRLGPLEGQPCDSINNTSSQNLISSVIVYPNPASDAITIEFSETLPAKEFVLEILNLSGRVILTRAVSTESNQVIQVSDFNPGMYLWRIKNQVEVSRTGKIIIN